MRILMIVLFGLLMMSSASLADPIGTQAEKKQVAESAQSIRNDRRDVDRLSDLVILWDRARKNNNEKNMQRLEEEIAKELRFDLAELRRDQQKAEAEVKQSIAESQRSRRALERERHDASRQIGAQRARQRDLKDDQRDLQDDVRDARAAARLLAEKRALVSELVSVQDRIDRAGNPVDAALRLKQRKLLEDYLEISQQEVRQGVRELNEDVIELNKDRR